VSRDVSSLWFWGGGVNRERGGRGGRKEGKSELNIEEVELRSSPRLSISLGLDPIENCGLKSYSLRSVLTLLFSSFSVSARRVPLTDFPPRLDQHSMETFRRHMSGEAPAEPTPEVM